MSTEKPPVTWKFHKLGGLDQVTLRTAEELRHLRELDPKVWVALSCPTTGIDLNHRMLNLIDTNKDSRIRVPEILDAVDWLCQRIKNPEASADSPHDLPLAQINDETEEGARLLLSAQIVLRNIEKADAETISPEDIAKAFEIAGNLDFNGDGILPPSPSFDKDLNQFIQDALEITGGVLDASGKPGINREIADAFVATLKNRRAWRETVGNTLTPLGDNTKEGWNCVQALRLKIDDYFLRCDLAAFAPDCAFSVRHHTGGGEAPAQAIMDEATLIQPTCATHGLLDADTLADLPLARIEPDKPLPLPSGVNPAWRERVEQFASAMAPLLPNPEILSHNDWKMILDVFAGYEEALAGKPAPETVEVDVQPIAAPDSLSNERIAAILDSDLRQRFNELMDQDDLAPSASGHLAELERLVLYYCGLHQLLMNFVSFYDFYTRHRKAAFQSGTLFIDGRACKLCLPVADVDKHAALASFSQVYLVYCDCTRTSPGGESQTQKIVAAVTVGSSDSLNLSRNGVFIDDSGNDWDASIVKIVSNPISISQAIWDPYQRFGKMMADQIGKFASAKQAEATDKLQKLAAGVTEPPAPGKTGGGFDIGRSVGIFAAIGIAIGAIGTAVASIARTLFALAWWQFPLLLLGIFLLISAPSMLLAWLKLRKRTLGPLLEASGWAVNGRIPINFFLGGALTAQAALPPNSTRSYDDPLSKKRSRRPYVLAGLTILAVVLAGCVYWFKDHPQVTAWIRAFVSAMQHALDVPPPAK